MISFVMHERDFLEYDKKVREVEKDLSLLGRVLERGGYPGTMNVLAVVFDKDFIRNSETQSLQGVDKTIRPVLEEVILSRLDKSFLEEVEDIRKRIVGASVEMNSGGILPLDFTPTDFRCNEEGELKVVPEKRDSFKERITLYLSEEEEEVYNTMKELLSTLREIKSRGWGVYSLVEKYIGRFSSIPEVDFSELPRDIRLYRQSIKTK